ncbi:MAG: 6,7-dimethyl-8-ribityllumazine synthase [Deltaproteobacteria bacterium]|nr:6,7-dimethyl-8-ribityllumazine synthase [Deltaproteobacteria bacterium]
MAKVLEGKLNAAGMRMALVVARFNDFISDRLLGGALDALNRCGASEEDLAVFKVPGAFELPLVAKKLAQSGRFDGVVCLGAVIRGATPHFDYVAAEAAKGIAQASLETEAVISFGVITADTLEQAIERAGSKAGNKGWTAAMAAIEMVDLLRQV